MLVSFSLPVTLAKLGIVPFIITLALMVKVTVTPEVMLPIVHLCVVALYFPCVSVELTNSSLGSNSSITYTPVAFEGPLFVTVIVYSTMSPT